MSKKTPLVSVIIPAYNHEHYIGPAMESVLTQTCGDLELIVIDDGSPDDTWEAINRLQDPRVIKLRQKNQDAYNTLNRGFSLARGTYIAILNSDDLYEPQRLERLLAEQKKTGAACIFTDVRPMDDNSRLIVEPQHPWIHWHSRNREYYFKCGNLYQAFLKGNLMVSTSNLFLLAEAVRRVGNFCALRYLHDYDYIFRVMLAYPQKVLYLDAEPLLRYRIHSGNTLGQGAITAREQDQQVIRKYLSAALPVEYQALAGAGLERLAELEQELILERKRLAAATPLYRLKMRGQEIVGRLIRRKGKIRVV